MLHRVWNDVMGISCLSFLLPEIFSVNLSNSLICIKPQRYITGKDWRNETSKKSIIVGVVVRSGRILLPLRDENQSHLYIAANKALGQLRGIVSLMP